MNLQRHLIRSLFTMASSNVKVAPFTQTVVKALRKLFVKAPETMSFTDG
jgi:hypothetical protein